MNTTTSTTWTPEQTLEHFQQKIRLPLLKDMLTSFFQAKATEKGDRLLRRPAIAVRLLDGVEHVFTIRPGWKAPSVQLVSKDHFQFDPEVAVLDFNVAGGRYVRVQQFGTFNYDRLYVDAIHQESGKCAKLNFDDTTLRMSSWYAAKYFSAVENFAQTAREFCVFPWQVFGRSKDRCGICGRVLTDELSRGRGIGPECLRHVSLCFGQPCIKGGAAR